MIIYPNKITAITGATSGISLKLKSDVAFFCFTGTATLGSNIVITGSGTPSEGMTCFMYFGTTLTLGSFTLTVLGKQVTNSIAAKPFWAMATYENGTWHVLCPGDNVGTGGIGVGVNGNGDLDINTNSITNAMCNTAMALAVTKLAALTPSQIAGLDSNGFLTSLPIATYPTLAELALVKGAAGGTLQSQIAAVIASLSNYETTAALASALEAYYTSAQVDSALANYALSSAVSSALTAYYTQTQVNSLLSNYALTSALASKTYNTPLTANTTLTSVTITEIILNDGTGGGFTVYLPLISTLADGEIHYLKQYGSNTITYGVNAGDTGFIVGTGGAATTLNLGGAGTTTMIQANKALKQWRVL